MDILPILGSTATYGESQGYRGLPVRHTTVLDPTQPEGRQDVPAQQTAWLPSAEELAALNNGMPIIVTILTPEDRPRPMLVEVGLMISLDEEAKAS